MIDDLKLRLKLRFRSWYFQGIIDDILDDKGDRLYHDIRTGKTYRIYAEEK